MVLFWWFKEFQSENVKTKNTFWRLKVFDVKNFYCKVKYEQV